MSVDRRPGRNRAPQGRSDRNRGKPQNTAKFRQKEVDPARVAARDVLRAVRERDAYANLVLPKMLRERGITGRDAAFATELAYGASRAQGLLDAVISSAAGRPVPEIDGTLLADGEVIDRVGEYRDHGATTVYFQVLDLRDLDHLRLIASEVMPALA